jgi:hypothetical protein
MFTLYAMIEYKRQQIDTFQRKHNALHLAERLKPIAEHVELYDEINDKSYFLVGGEWQISAEYERNKSRRINGLVA